MLRRLSLVSSALDPGSPITLTESQICLDSFVPGREAADCEFITVAAQVTLRPSK